MNKIVSISGGKDSTATALLAIESKKADDKLFFIFCDTGNEHSLTYDYVRYLSEQFQKLCGVGITWLKADFTEKFNKRRAKLDEIVSGWQPDRAKSAKFHIKQSFIPMLDLSMIKGRFPSSFARFCTTELKVEPSKKFISKFLAKGEDCENWTGIRADESPKRAMLPTEELFLKDEATGAECWTQRPILHWKASQCFDKIKEYHLEINPLYKMGFSRVGCMPCINARKNEIREIAERFPAEIYRIESWEKIVGNCSKRGASTFFPDSDGGGY